MDGTNGLKETTRVTAPVASNTLSVNRACPIRMEGRLGRGARGVA